MFKVNFKKVLLNSIIILVIFLIDRISKIYILKIAELENMVDIYLTSYINLYLIWNKGIAFGLFSFEESFIYQSISLVIFIISIVLIIMMTKSEGFKKYSLILILGGALGNLFDRIYYSAVPDFIDLHIKGFHWFIFNVADIFITIGVICLILDELFFYKKNNEIN
ncbi:signal peptidase II [Candidatus Pelagibacter sp.]|jgi:signal peptidase II|nr:signal peptidase II [Candidatus Pelagibacter sp.]